MALNRLAEMTLRANASLFPFWEIRCGHCSEQHATPPLLGFLRKNDHGLHFFRVRKRGRTRFLSWSLNDRPPRCPTCKRVYPAVKWGTCRSDRSRTVYLYVDK